MLSFSKHWNADFRASKRSGQNDESSAVLSSIHIRRSPPDFLQRIYDAFDHRGAGRSVWKSSGNPSKSEGSRDQIWMSRSFSSSQSSSDDPEDEIPTSPQAKQMRKNFEAYQKMGTARKAPAGYADHEYLT
jgi:hypothetical protein